MECQGQAMECSVKALEMHRLDNLEHRRPSLTYLMRQAKFQFKVIQIATERLLHRGRIHIFRELADTY